MLFNSLSYAVFLPVVFALYWLLPHKYRVYLLFVSSYFFYLCWNVKYIVLILFTTLVSYGAALFLSRCSTVRSKKRILGLTAFLCLSVLFVFKYFNFLSESLEHLSQALSLPHFSVRLNLLLPVGISFYTFQTLSYVIDVYRGQIAPERNFIVYATFVSFFPQLVAGPIERTCNLLPQITSVKTFDYNKASSGLKLMAWGFFKKLAIADVLASYVDVCFSSPAASSGFDLIVATVFFAIQIYCDFSGYSDIAIASAKLLGIDLMTNFRSPYLSKSIKEFWSRWHISLSTWFRDYVYIPLGGNRCSAWKHARNLFLTFLLSGLWHGASWTFVIWGAVHGVAQIIESRIPRKLRSIPLLSPVFVFLFCCVTWVFFRAESLADAVLILQAMGHSLITMQFNPILMQIPAASILRIVGAICILFAFDYASLKTDVIAWISRRPAAVRWTIYLAFVWTILFCLPVVGNTEFVYFQF